MVVLTACAILVALVAPSVLAQTIEILKPAHFPYVGNRVAVWALAQLHILFAAFVLGAPIFVVISEWLGVRSHDPKYDRLAKEVTKITAILYSMTALTGGFFLLALVTLYPDFTGWLFNHFFLIMGIGYPLLFILETLVLYFYWYTWDGLQGDKKGRHLAIGVLLNVIGIVTLFAIDGPTSFMNTPVKAPEGMTMNLRDFIETTATLWDKMNNFSWMPMNFHRLAGNVTFGGFITGLIAAYMYMFSKTDEERAYYDWMGFVGNFIGISALLVLPLMGYVYAAEFYDYDASIGPYMMADQLSMFFIMQGGMIGLIFLASAYYIWMSLKRIEIPDYSTAVSQKLVAGVLSAIVPGLGQMYNGQWGAGIAFLVGQGALLGSIFYVFSLHAHEGLGLSLLLLLFPLAVLIASSSNAMTRGSSSSPGRSLLVLPVRLLAQLLLALERFGLRRRELVIKCAFLILLLGNATWMTPHAFVGAVSSLTDENEAFLSLPSNWDFLALMPAKLTAVGLMVLMILVSFILYTRAIKRGTIRWGKIDFSSQFALIFLAFGAIWTMGLMGVIRSSLRKYFHIYDVLPDLSPNNFTPTLGYSAVVITILAVIFFAVVSLAIWLALGAGHTAKKGAQS
ncbi:MAG: cytochrome ubiquinol oxidase subunit I [Nitrospirae bacterium]|nr:cytochrome ubiquinol oxidase subunit I [Nitrospirota bacterium]